MIFFKYKAIFIKLNLKGDDVCMVKGRCMKCKAEREMKDAKETTMKNGRKAMKGVCVNCGTNMFRIMSKK